MGEFDLIARYFKRPVRRAVLGVGDDCALLQPRAGTQMAISTDMLVSGRHFLPDTDPERLGHKCLAVNLSDLAACGATPLAFTLALSLPEPDEAWLARFSQGLLALADAHGCELVGGDTTRGPLNVCITVFGEVPVSGGQSQALLRSGARVGDDLYVSGNLGDAAIGLETLIGGLNLPPDLALSAQRRLEQPTPRVALGQALRGTASAAIDVSDGLLGDLGHILQQSGVGATVQADIAIESIATYQACTRASGHFDLEISHDRWRQWALAGGDDYELLFTAPFSARAAVQDAAQRSQTPVTRIGQIDAGRELQVLNSQGQRITQTFASFDHFVR